MISKKLLAALVGLAFASAAHAGPQLIAIGTINGNQGDLSRDTAGPLENGVSGNLLGGMGSGLAWAGGSTFIATPDRGPNATAYNPLVDDTTSYIARFQTLTLALTPNNSGSGLAFTLTPTLTATTLLSSQTALSYGTGALGTGTVNGVNYTLGSGAPALNASKQTNYFTGRSDNFDPSKSSLNPNNARLDPEGARVSNDGKSVFISDEYGPYVYQFDRSTGERIASFALPGNLGIANLRAQGALEIADNKTSGRVSNKGMEGLAITPDGKMLVGIMQAPLAQDTSKTVRIVTIVIATGEVHEYAYQLTTGSGVSEIVALNNHQFLVDERDGKGLGDGTAASAKQLFKIDLDGAQDITALSGNIASKAVSKTLLLDIVNVLGANGMTPTQVPAKIEGIAFGDDVMLAGVLTHTLYVANDNDFVANIAGDNKFFVFGVSDADLNNIGASYTPQGFVPADVPEPASALLMGLGLLMLGSVRRRR